MAIISSSHPVVVNIIKSKALWVINALVEVLIDVFWFWQLKIQEYMTRADGTAGLKLQLQRAQSYEEWEQFAYKMDSQLGNDLWYVLNDFLSGRTRLNFHKLTL